MCREVQVGITQSIQVPVMGFLERAREVCEEARQRIEEHVSQPVENWVSQLERRCHDLPWWNPARWFCELVSVVVKVVTWVVVTIVKWVVYLSCRITVEVVSIVVGFVIKVVKWFVTTLVCLFSDPAEAGKALRDLWMAVVQLGDDVVDLAVGLLSAAEGILGDVENLFGALADYLGAPGNVIFGLAQRIAKFARDIINSVSNVVDGVGDLVLGGLSLNPCRMFSGITSIGLGIGRLLLTGIRLVPGTFTGVKETFDHDSVQDVVTGALNTRFSEDPVRLERSIERCAVGSVPMGVPFTVDPRRYYLSSTSDSISLSQLHRDGTINLFELAGYMAECRPWLNFPRAEVVYAGSDVPVTYADIDAFLRGDTTPPFRVYAMSTQVFTRYLEVARRKAQQLGIRLYWRPFGDIENTRPNQLPQVSTNPQYPEEFAAFGRTGVGDDLSVLPSLALFWYDDSSLNGLASWFRPTSELRNPKSGVSFRDRQPEWVFQWVLVHEMGHYWGLDHDGHDGLGLIMFRKAESNSYVTGGTFAEYVLLSGEPRFTVDDARTAWEWITMTAADTVLP